jgi:plastocyanin
MALINRLLHRSHNAAVLPLIATAAILAACSSSGASTPVAALDTPVPPAALATIPSTATPIAAASGPAVTIDNFNFVSAALTVPAGTTVVWTNRDDVPHTITSSSKAFDSGPVQTDGQFSFTFATPGTYTYFCAIHPFMTGKVIVQ